MINTFVNKYFFYLYTFTLCFGVLLYNTTGFKGLDVLSSVALVVLYFIFIIGTKNKSFHIGFLTVMLVFLFFLNYSFYIANNSLSAITIDFLTQLRPYVAFFLVLQISPTFTDQQKNILKKICFYLWLFYIPIGILATINTSFLNTMMEQSSNYTACIFCLAVIYLFCSNFTVKDKLTFIFMLSAGLIAIESRFYIFFLIVCGLIMFFHHIDVLKNNLKTGFALALIVCIIVYISRTEILNFLFSTGIAGDGFASLATQTSSGFYTQLNNSGFNPVNGFFYQEWFTGSASYYPFLAQLGLIGIFVFLSFWIYIITASVVQFKQKNDIQPFILVLMLTVFIFVENISESFFTSNKGYFMMMFIGLLMGKPEDAENMVALSDKKNIKKKRFAALQAVWFFRKKSMTNTHRNQVAKEITYIIPPMPIRNVEAAGVNENNHIDVIQDIPVVQHEVDINYIEQPEEIETLHSVTENIEELIETIDNSHDETITTMQPPIEVDTTSEIILADADDEYEWDDDFDNDDNDDWEADFENEVIMASEQKIEKDAVDEIIAVAAAAASVEEETADEIIAVAAVEEIVTKEEAEVVVEATLEEETVEETIAVAAVEEIVAKKEAEVVVEAAVEEETVEETIAVAVAAVDESADEIISVAAIEEIVAKKEAEVVVEAASEEETVKEIITVAASEDIVVAETFENEAAFEDIVAFAQEVENEAEKVLLFDNYLQSSATDTPAQMTAMLNQFDQSAAPIENRTAFIAEEYLSKNTTRVEEEISDDDIADGSYTYMI